MVNYSWHYGESIWNRAPDGINIKENSGVAELRNAADNEFAAGRALRLQPGATINDIATAIDISRGNPKH